MREIKEKYTCKNCGKDVEWSWSDPKHSYQLQLMDAQSLCFTCGFWAEKLEAITNKTQPLIVVKGNMYWIAAPGREKVASWKGFGGAKFAIHLFKPNFTFACDNLWHNGQIPDNFLQDLPDTAEFIQAPVMVDEEKWKEAIKILLEK